MKWSVIKQKRMARLLERESEFDSRFVWWIKQSEAERKIKELKQKIKELKQKIKELEVQKYK